MAAPGGILHKVQLHFEKYIQFTAVPAHSFSPVLSSIKKKENKKERNGLRMHLWPSRPCIYAGGWRTFGECREL